MSNDQHLPPRPPEQSPEPTEPRKAGNWFARHKVLTAVLVVVVLAGLGSALSGGGDGAGAGTGDSAAAGDAAADNAATGDSAADTGGEAEAEQAAGLNTAVRDGKFEFTVTGVDCGQSRVGNEYLGVAAQGQFCMVSMTVENIGKEPQSLFGDNQKLFDAEGREFSADTEAGMYLDQENQTLFEEINPGNTVEGIVVFDIPKDATPSKLELHDSAFSSGVVVEL